MRLLIVCLATNMLFLVSAFSELGSDVSFTQKDMWTLSRKISKSLQKCKQLRQGKIVVDVQNATTEFLDKTQFSDLIHSMIEKKSHSKLEIAEPDYEIRAKLEFQKPIYILTAQVFQAEEKLCEKKVKISKREQQKNTNKGE